MIQANIVIIEVLLLHQLHANKVIIVQVAQIRQLQKNVLQETNVLLVLLPMKNVQQVLINQMKSKLVAWTVHLVIIVQMNKC